MGVKWCQSKHARLISKCYPPRTANPPKPNSSELSYLTYYAYTTPSKLKKVGKYLEHRAHVGLTKGRTGDVLVTLDICTALVKKCFRDLGLFASNIVAILDAVVKDEELILVEHSVLTLREFCNHHDGKLLLVSREFRSSFHALCKGYAKYGVEQEDMRAQKASLDALSAFVSSEAFHSSTAGGQFKIIISALVKILAQSSVPLTTLQLKLATEASTPTQRRQSFFARENSVVPSIATPRSSAQIDYSEEENSLIALKNAKQVCEMNNPGLVRIGLDTFMDNLASVPKGASRADDEYVAWAVEFVQLALTWLPIQHRYIAVLASLEDLDSKEGGLDKSISSPKQELVLCILEGILTTKDSLIGLNVMDVLNSLIGKVAIQLKVRPSTKADVVQKLVNCIVGLAGHVYYSDQIRDMSSALMDWSKPFYAALTPISGKDSPATEGEEEILEIMTAAIWSLRAIRGVLIQGGGSVGLEEVWTGTEGLLGCSDGDLRMEYIDALTTHLRAEESEDDAVPDAGSQSRFLSRIHVALFNALKRDDSGPSDYWGLWVLLVGLLEKFGAKEVVKCLPMMWRLLDVIVAKRDRRACVEGIVLGFLSFVAGKFKISDLKQSVTTTLDEWPLFIDPSTRSTEVTLHDISSTLLVMPSPTETPHPLPTELHRTTLINALAFSTAFPESLREHLLVQWSEETSMPEHLSYTPESQSEARHNVHLSASHSRSTNSLQSPSIDDNLLAPGRKKSLSRYRSPSPNTHINQLRNVLAADRIPRSHDETVPKIEVNGEKVETPSSLSFTPPMLGEKEVGEGGVADVTLILESLAVKGGGEGAGTVEDVLSEKVVGDGGVMSPPYGI